MRETTKQNVLYGLIVTAALFLFLNGCFTHDAYFETSHSNQVPILPQGSRQPAFPRSLVNLKSNPGQAQVAPKYEADKNMEQPQGAQNYEADKNMKQPQGAQNYEADKKAEQPQEEKIMETNEKMGPPRTVHNRERNGAVELPKEQKAEHKPREEKAEKLPFPMKIWISSSVCWSKNTDLNGKSKYPYKLGAHLSASLWRNKTGASTLIQVIYEEHDREHESLAQYISKLRNDGNTVIPVATNGTDCSLQAQIQRMFPYTVPDVQPEDLVITTDVDAFILDPTLMDPFREAKYKIWLLLYSETLSNETTFSMSFIGMRSKLWKIILQGATNPKELFHKFRSTPLANLTQAWDEDQRILSQAILESRICSAPSKNSIWTKVGMNPTGLTESDTPECFYGYNFEYCNKYHRTLPGGCKWWHTTRGDTKDTFQEIYSQSLANELIL